MLICTLTWVFLTCFMWVADCLRSGRRDVCLLSNIIKLYSIRPVGLKASRSHITTWLLKINHWPHCDHFHRNFFSSTKLRPPTGYLFNITVLKWIQLYINQYFGFKENPLAFWLRCFKWKCFEETWTKSISEIMKWTRTSLTSIKLLSRWSQSTCVS